MSEAASVARRLLASLLTRSRHKPDGGNSGGESFQGLEAPTCSHRAAGPGQAPPNRTHTTGNTRTRRAERCVSTSSRQDVQGRVSRRVAPALFSFITFYHFSTSKITLKTILKIIFALIEFVSDLKKINLK